MRRKSEKNGRKMEEMRFLFKWGVCSMGVAPRGYEWHEGYRREQCHEIPGA